MDFTADRNKAVAADWALAALTFALSLAAFLRTLPFAFLFDDNPEFIAGAFRLGVVHPPGYPLFLLLGRLANAMPFPDPAFAANFASAFAGALAAAAFFAAARRTGLPAWAAAWGAMTLAFSRSFWSESLGAEVYSLNVLLCFLGFLAWLRWRDGREPSHAAAFFALAALGLLNHYSALLIFVPLAAGIAGSGRGKSLGRAASAGLLAAAVASALLWFLPLRAAASPALLWENVTTPARLAAHLRGINLGGSFDLAAKAGLAAAFLRQTAAQFGPGSLAVLPFGLFALWKNRGVPSLPLWTVLFLSCVLGILIPIHYPASARAEYVLSHFYLPAFSILTLALAAGASWIVSVVKPRALKIFLVPSLFALPAAQGILFGPQVDQSRNFLPWNYTVNLLSTPPPGSRLLLPGETEMFAAVCLREAFGARPDLVIYGIHGEHSEAFLPRPRREARVASAGPVEALETALASEADRIPSYSSLSRNPLSPATGKMRSAEGLLYRLGTAGAGRPDPWSRYAPMLEGLNEKRAANLDYISAHAAARILTREIDRDLQNGDREAAKEKTDRLIRWFPAFRFVRMQAGDRRLAMRDLIGARRDYEKALTLPQEDLVENLDAVSAHNNLAAIHRAGGDLDKAIEHARKAADLAPELAAVHFNLAMLYFDAKRHPMAAERFQKASDLGMETAESLNKWAIALEKTGALKEALERYQRAVRKSPAYPDVYKDFGIFMALHQDNRQAAALLWKRYLELAPNAPDREAVEEEIARFEKENPGNPESP